MICCHLYFANNLKNPANSCKIHLRICQISTQQTKSRHGKFKMNLLKWFKKCLVTYKVRQNYHARFARVLFKQCFCILFLSYKIQIQSWNECRPKSMQLGRLEILVRVAHENLKSLIFKIFHWTREAAEKLVRSSRCFSQKFRSPEAIRKNFL